MRFAFSKEEEEEEEEEDEDEEHGQSVTICENCVYLYFTPPVIFSSIFLHAVTFSHVLHLDVLRRQIELKLKAKLKFPYVWL